MDDRYVDYKVPRDQSGKLVVDQFNRDPNDDYWYDPNSDQWVAKYGGDRENDLSVDRSMLLDTMPMGKASEDAMNEILDRWESAAAEYDQITGAPGSLPGDYPADRE